MKRELRIFFTALSFYSRIPVPARFHADSAQYLPDAIRYLPIVGWIAGLLAAAVYMAANYLFGSSIAILFSMAATIVITGAFHEDGFADVCDGFGGGYTKEKILHIMKDSRLGTFGVLGLILLLALKFAALQQLSLFKFYNYFGIAASMVAAHSLSRFAAIAISFQMEYARLEDSKVSTAVQSDRGSNLIIATVLTLIPMLALAFLYHSVLLLTIIIPAAAITTYMGRYFKKWIGGYTGDCLGAVQQISELSIYLSLIVIWRFI